MKSTGIVRKVDGRVVVPMELRRTLGIENNAPIEIFVDNDQVTLRKYKSENASMVTGEITNENKVYSGNIVLSPQGCKIILEELRNDESSSWMKEIEKQMQEV